MGNMEQILVLCQTCAKNVTDDDWAGGADTDTQALPPLTA